MDSAHFVIKDKFVVVHQRKFQRDKILLVKDRYAFVPLKGTYEQCVYRFESNFLFVRKKVGMADRPPCVYKDNEMIVRQEQGHTFDIVKKTVVSSCPRIKLSKSSRKIDFRQVEYIIL